MKGAWRGTDGPGEGEGGHAGVKRGPGGRGQRRGAGGVEEEGEGLVGGGRGEGQGGWAGKVEGEGLVGARGVAGGSGGRLTTALQL